MKKILISIICVFLFVLLSGTVFANPDVEIVPSEPTETDMLTCQMNGGEGYNPDLYLYEWYKNGQHQTSLSGWGEDNIISYYTDIGDVWKCKIYMPGPVWPHVPIYLGEDTVTIGCNDIDNDGVCDEDEIPFLDLVVTATPDEGDAPLEVQFTCTAEGGNLPLSYSWSFGDSTYSNAQNPVHTYDEVGTYTAVCTAHDSDNDVITGGLYVEVTETIHILNITSLECFPVVIVDANQACSVTVEDQFGPVGDVVVDIYHLSGGYFGTCLTDSISGGCTAHELQEEVGTFTVYATAMLNGYEPDVDHEPQFTYEVWDHDYDIIDLDTYNDPLFQNLDDVFYRGEDLYIKFRVVDLATGEDVCDDIVTAATLLSNDAGGMINLTRMDFDRECGYYYELNMIPLTHDFIGDSNVFAFALNLPDYSGGQAQVDLTILNNPPVITPEIDDIVFNEDDETYTLNLANHEFDLEDSGNDLSWTVQESSPCINADVHNKNLVIIGLDACQADIVLKLYDLDNDYDVQTVHVSVTEGNQAPVADFDWTPLEPFVDEQVKFTAQDSYDPDGDDLTYAWDIDNDGSTDYTGLIAYHTFTTAGNHPVKLTVSDGELGDSVVQNVFVDQHEIIVTEIVCLNPVIVDAYQDCSVSVEDEAGNPLGGVNISIYYIDGSKYGQCESNSINGGCAVLDLQEEVGTFTVYATAMFDGYEPDVDHEPQFTYEVWEHDYDIVGLAIYNDSEFHNPDDVFYRGEDLYIRFRVIDLATGEDVCDDIVTAATLISQEAGGMINLTRMTFNANRCCWYEYELDMIPLTHDFIGDSNVFAFAFNVPEQSGGQAHVPLTILNNPPEITPKIPYVIMGEDETHIYDLSGHEFDLEDSGSDLTWTVEENTGTCYDTDIENKDLVIIPSDGCEGYITLRLYDLDMDYDQQTIHVTVREIPDVNFPPEANILEPEDDSAYFEGDSITFVGHCHDLEDGEITGASLEWESNIDGFLSYGETFTHVLSPGTHTVTLTCEDSEGLTGTDSILIFVGEDLDFTGIEVTADPMSGYAPLEVNFYCEAYGGNSPISYSWDIEELPSTEWEDSEDQYFTHTFEEPGNYTVTCTAYDSDDDEISGSVVVNVEEEHENQRPVISPIQDQTISEGDSFTQFDLDDHVEDPDNTDAELRWTYSGNTDIDVNIARNHVVTLTYPAGWWGSEIITFVVTDPEGLSAHGRGTFTVHLEDVPIYLPTVNILQPADGSEFDEGDSITFVGEGNDPEDGILSGNSLTWSSSIDGFLGYGESISTDALSQGTHTISLMGVDSDGMHDTDSITIYIEEESYPFVPECSDGLDNDGDGFIDMDDPGCDSPSDDSEYNSYDKDDDLYIGKIRLYGYEWQYVKPGQLLQAFVSMENFADDDFEDLRVTLMIPELGIKVKGGQFDLDEGDHTTEFLQAYIPGDVQPGLYYVKLQISNDDLRRTKYRYIIVQE